MLFASQPSPYYSTIIQEANIIEPDQLHSVENRLSIWHPLMQHKLKCFIKVVKALCIVSQMYLLLSFPPTGVTTPTAHCVLLANETQVIVTPKVRSSTIGQPVVEKPISKEVTGDLDVPYLRNPGDMDEVDSFDPKFSSTDSELSLPGELLYLSSQSNILGLIGLCSVFPRPIRQIA